MNEPLISVNGLVKQFDGRRVLDGCSLAVAGGEVFGLVGLNGAGKTTLIRLILGLLRPDGGELTVNGRVPWGHDAGLYRDCGVVLEHDGFSGSQTFMQNIGFYADARGLCRRELDDYLRQWWQECGLVTSRQKARFYSRGQKMSCALCRAFLGWPKTVLLDEPVIALDVTAQDHFKRLVRHAQSLGSAVVISSHQLETIEELCGAAGILQDGTLRTVDLGRTPGGVSRWRIRVSEGEQAAAVINRFAAAPACFCNGAWEVEVCDADTVVPRLVSALVYGGVGILEVRREEGALRREILKPVERTGAQ